MSIEERLAELGVELPPPPKPVASYVPVRVSGSLAFVAGQVPMEGGTPTLTGRVGSEVSLEEAVAGARRCALQALSALREELRSLDRVRGIVKLTVFVASDAGFTDQPLVANGASDLLVEILGEAGRHARSAVSCPSLPLGAAVEVEVTAEIA